MKEELKGLEDNKKSVNKKKILVIILIALAIVLLVIGGVLIYKSLDKNPSSNQTGNDNSESKIIVFDDYFKDFKFNLTEQSRLDLIDSTSRAGYSDDLYHGAMFSDVISNEYKTIYTIDKATWMYLNDNYDFYVSNMGKEIKLNKSTIEYLAKQLFVDFSMPESIEKTWFGGIYDLVCTSEECSYSYTTFGLTGSFADGYLFKPEENGNSIIVKPIYAVMDDYIESTDAGLVGNFTLYKDHNKELIKKFNKYEILYTNDVYSNYTQDVYDLWVGEYSSLSTYKYTFTEDHKLISVQKN